MSPHGVVLAVSVHGLIVHYGYEAVFALVAMESLGIPLPGETALVAAATYAGTTNRLSVWGVFAAAALGAVMGDTIGYWIGDAGGYRLLFRYGRYVHLDEPKIKLARYLFDRRGGAVVFFGRWVSVLRTYAAFLAGTNLMRYRRFLLFNVTGGFLWAAFYSFTGYYASSFLSKASTSVDVAFGSAAVAAIVVGILVIRRRLKPLEARAEEAYPGPLVHPGRHRPQRATDDGDRSEPGGGARLAAHADTDRHLPEPPESSDAGVEPQREARS